MHVVCGCTAQGTEPTGDGSLASCELDTGQCTCARAGIIGRTCDYCAKGSKGKHNWRLEIYFRNIKSLWTSWKSCQNMLNLLHIMPDVYTWYVHVSL